MRLPDTPGDPLAAVFGQKHLSRANDPAAGLVKSHPVVT
ncbi:hypothetical protein ART_2748 [Arthrobacter sp. PAMC 25486]|nr:hypothetical protein ART_2748 [Arthrobacter sp. PAMC 25486]